MNDGSSSQSGADTKQSLPPPIYAFPGSECDSAVDWLSPNKVLADFLSALGILHPRAVTRDLLNEFGSLPDILSASTWRLRHAVGFRLATTIGATRHLMCASLAFPLRKGPIVPRSQALGAFLQMKIGFLQHEQILAVYVDHQHTLLRIQKIADGGFRGAEMDFRRIISCGLGIAASGFILVHNHPSGIPGPSQADLAVTARLRNIVAELDLHLIDHLIIARGQIASIQDYWREAEWRGPALHQADVLAG